MPKPEGWECPRCGCPDLRHVTDDIFRCVKCSLRADFPEQQEPQAPLFESPDFTSQRSPDWA